MTERTLSLHERYSLARAQCGMPAIVHLVAELRGVAAATAADALCVRTQELLRAYPLLSAAVAGGTTRRPRFRRAEDGAVTPDMIVQLLPPDRTVQTPADALRDALAASAGGRFDVAAGPLWAVRVRPAPCGEFPEEEHCYVALSVNHVINDGRGCLNLLGALLSCGPLALADSEAPAFPPKAEDTLPYAPSWTRLLSTVWAELLVPRLPSFLQARLRPAAAWPAHAPLGAVPAECAVALANVECADTLIEGLKRAAKSIGTGTIHALIHTACLAALLVAARRGGGAADANPGAVQEGDYDYDLASSTPVSLRSAALGHPVLTGNYAGDAPWRRPSRALLCARIADLTRTYHAAVATPHARREAAGSVGMLAYVPDGKELCPSEAQAHTQGAGKEGQAQKQAFGRDAQTGALSPHPTGWERFFAAKARQPAPYRASFELSNLGLLPAPAPAPAPSARPLTVTGGADTTAHGLADKVQRLWFTQGASPVGAAIGVDVVGVRVSSGASGVAGAGAGTDADAGAGAGAGVTRLGITVAWREGALDGALVRRFARALGAALAVLAASSGDDAQVALDAPLERLCELVEQAVAL